MTHIYLGIVFHSHGHFEPSRKREKNGRYEYLDGPLRKEAVVGVTCWDLTSHLFKALVLPTLT